MKIRTNFSRWRKGKLAPFAIIAGLAIVSAGAIKVWAETRVGDFANNVKTTLSILDRDGNAEKVNFLSGETMTFSSRVEVTSDNQVSSYPGAYMLIKFPREYAASRPRIDSTDAVSSRAAQDTNTHYIERLNYRNLIAGSINSINSQYTLKNNETPEGYQPEVVHELYSADGTLLSRQVKSTNTTKIDFTTSVTNSKSGGASNSHYIAKYTDQTNTAIDKDSYEKLGVMSFNMRADMYYPAGNNGNGKRNIVKVHFEYKVPEHMVLTQKSIDGGWTFDSVSRIAQRTVSSIDNVNNWARASIELSYTKDTDDSIINSRVAHEYKAIFESADGSRKESNGSLAVQVLAQQVGSKGSVSIRKSGGGDYRLPSRYDAGLDRFVYNLAASGSDYRGSWGVYIEVKGNANSDGQGIVNIEDSLPEGLQFEGVRINMFDLLRLFNGVNQEGSIKVILHKADGSELEVGELSNDIYSVDFGSVGDIAEYRRMELRFPDGYKLPPPRDQENGYHVYIEVRTRITDFKDYAESIPFNSAPVSHTNRVSMTTVDGTVNTSGNAYYERKSTDILNNIIIGSRRPTYGVGDTVQTYLYPARDRSTKSIDVGNLKNAKRAILYSPGFALSDRIRQGIASGDLEYHENYKNSGKSAIIALKPDSTYLDDYSNYFIVTDTVLNGEHQFELVTFWDEDDANFTGTEGLDDLDFNGDSQQSRNVARSTTKIIVLKPEQVAIKKYVRTPGSDFATSVDKLDAGQAIDYRISVINTSDQPLLSSRILEVLPKIGDKKIVEGNNGIQENRGSTTGAKMTGPIAPRDGFTISYSTDEPGVNQAESWGKNFVSADRITDWSAVRMVKIVQNQGHQVSPQEIVHFIINAKIDESSADNSVANNTAAVAISATGNLVETDPVRATVNFPIKIQGVAFMDNNRNSLFDDGVDTILPNYKVEILRNNTVVAELKTNDRGEYSYLTKDWGANFSVRFTRPAGLDPQAVLVPARNGSNTKANGSAPTTETGGVATTSSVNLTATSDKTQNRNIGLYLPKGTLKVEYRYTKNINGGVPYGFLKNSETILTDVAVGTQYDVQNKRLAQISDDAGLVYEFESVNAQTPENGAIKEGEQTVVFQYKPKKGGSVKAKFINEQDEELKPEVVVKENQTQVGTPYASTKENELTKNNLVYTFKQLKVNSAPENGRVTENEQIITYVYAPKQGGSVKARFINEQGEELLAETEIKPRGTQVGVEYASTKQNELQKNGLTYIFKELKNDSAPENGRVKAEDQVVTYVYAPKLGGSVIAKFINQDGVSIQPDETIKAQQTQIGTRYTSNYPNEITANDGITYVFEKIVDGSAPREGQVNGDAQVITYRYVPKKGGAVTVEFVTKTGEKLKTDEVVKATDTPVGTQYASTKENELTKNNLVYTFESLKQGSAPENGKVKAEAQTVTYVYVPKLGGKVDAKFLDENGREIKPLENVSPDKTQVGTSYSSTPSTEITFENIVYVYKGLGQNSAPQNGRVSEGAQTISYIYTPKRGGSVIVNFVNEDGESIKDTQILKADGTPVGTAYEAQEDAEIEKDNLVYIFKELKDGSKPKNGRVSEDSTEVTFVYSPKPGGKVVAKFTTANGTELQDEEEVSPQDTQVGTEYASTKPEEIKKDGLVYIFKELKEDSAPEEGRVKSDAQTVNYIYEPKLGDAVSMRFIDTNGVLLGKIEEILPKGKQVGTPYEAKIPETITIDGKTYRLKIIRSDDGDAGEKGEVSENPQMITVIFEFVPPVKTPNTGFNKSEDSFNLIIVIAGFAILAGASVAVVAKQKSSKK